MQEEERKKPALTPWVWAVVVFAAGAFLRLYFISSHGSWDTEYWKAWASETAYAGVTQAYGGPDSVPPGDFVPQLLGEKPRHEVSFRGREFPIDYPPLALAAWGQSWRFFTSKPRPYRGAEAENLAVKFPAVLGDLLAVLVLLWAFRGDRPKAVLLAALYWIFPVTWVSSSVLGFFDGFLPAFLLVSLLLTPTAPLVAGAAFAVTCLIKPTAAVALPFLFLAVSRSSWLRVISGGAVVTTLVLLPYLLAGTLPTAIIHMVRLFSQERVSGGYANPWWVLGHGSMVRRELAEWPDPIYYVKLTDFDWPLGFIGFAAMAVVALRVLFEMRGRTSIKATLYASALIFFAWGMLTIGVHDNHNHPLFLLLVATGLQTPFVRGFAFTVATSTLLGSVSLHGLGRFYGTQWREVLPLADSVARLRMSPGFDLTLLLAVVNCVLLILALWRLERTLNELEET